MSACDFLFYCLSIYWKRILLLLHIVNIHTLSENIKFICTSFRKADRKANLWRAFLSYFTASANEFYIFRQWTYIVFILQCQKKNPNQQQNCLISAEISVVLIVFLWCPLRSPRICTVTVPTVALHESGTSKAISWSVVVYNKTVSGQCNFK
jgi:hypothetical protein